MPELWPATIPAPVNSFEHEQKDVSARTGDQFGVKTTRRRMTNAPSSAQLQFVLLAAEKAALDVFYYSTTNSGCKSFTADWLALVLSTHHCAKITEYSAQVAGKNSNGIIYTASMSIEIMDKGEVIEGYLHPWYDPQQAA